MTDYAKIGCGIGVFSLSYLMIFLLQYLIPPLVNTLNEVYPSTELVGLSWFGTILIMIIGQLVAPTLFIISGINTENKDLSKGQNIIISIIWLIFGLGITIKGWFMIPLLSEMLLSPFLVGLFYLSLLIVWFGGVFATPINEIVKQYNRE